MSIGMKDLSRWTDRIEKRILAAEELRWQEIEEALSHIPESEDKGLYGLCCYYAGYYCLMHGRQEECLGYMNEGIRCMVGTEQEKHVSRCYNALGIIAHGQNNLILALEQYDMALAYAERYQNHFMHSLVASNMADAYFRMEAYERAIRYYGECLREFENAKDHSANAEYNYKMMLAGCGYCLAMAGRFEEAKRAADYLWKISREGPDEKVPEVSCNTLFAFLAYQRGNQKCTDEFIRIAIENVASKKQITSEFDSLLNLIHFIVLAKRYDDLKRILDYAEPIAAIERNDGLLLQLLLYRLKYCSQNMTQEEFLGSAQTFFRIKEKYENRENIQILHMMEMRNRLREIEEEQLELKKKNSQLLYQMDHDTLSGAYCKRCLNRYLEKVFDEAVQKQIPLGILFVDIDYFKQINDRYGHGRGDECVVAVARVIQNCMPRDFTARYGGDEFVVVAVGRTSEYIEQRAGRLIQGIRELKIPNQDSETAGVLTVTVGAVNAVPQKPNKVWDFLSVADSLLYEQKEAEKGRYRFRDQLEETMISGVNR